jgi:hypothetical protein
VQGMYSSLRMLRTTSAKPPACAAWRVLGSDVANVWSSARKRWTQRSQFTGHCVRREVVQLHAVVVAQAPHEAARRRREAALVEAGEADNVAVRGVGNSVPLRRHDPLRRLPIHVRCQLAARHQQIQRQRRRRQALPHRRVNYGDGLLGGHMNGRGDEELEARTAPRAEARRQERLGG